MAAWVWLLLAGLIGAATTAVELHRAADGAWWLRSFWGWTLVCADGISASALSVYVSALIRGVHTPQGAAAAVGCVIAGLLGARLLYLIPIPIASSAGKAFITLRSYILLVIEREAAGRRNSWVIDYLYPAAHVLGFGLLFQIAVVQIEDLQRHKKFNSDVGATEFLMSAIEGALDEERRVCTLVCLLLDYGGRPIAEEIIRRSHGHGAVSSSGEAVVVSHAAAS